MLLHPSKFGTNLRLWTGVVVDRNDPIQKGRVRVRIFGLYGTDQDVPDDQLPWAVVMMPPTSAAIAGIGLAPVGLMDGSMVVCMFLDGEDMQQPVVLGSLGAVTESLGILDGAISPDGVLDYRQYNGPSNAKFVGDGPRWFQAAQGELGVKEIKGSQHHPRVLQYAATNGFSTDETPWCSSFVKWCLEQAGLSTTGANGLARSWLRAGCVEEIDEPLHGCIMVFNRPPEPGEGHVAFLESIVSGTFRVLGGNQSNSVNIASYAPHRLLGMFWPKGQPKDGFEIS